MTEKSDHGMITADEGLLLALEKAGLVKDLSCTDEHVHFSFPDSMVRLSL